jgi:TolB-like protein/tetratricopeptide (TPR) repeat protein
MSDANKAVFLSYASQDAQAAKKICDALRAAGVEVWFDQSELRGGDAWDQSIRRQIKECALFVPIVSANTQARREGYFRLEWKLADDRTHLMAKGTRFILPVCVDDTKDWDAIVPDSFTTVQWTRLAGGEGAVPFAERAKKLLSGSELETGRPRPASRDEGVAFPTSATRAERPPWLTAVIVIVPILVGLAFAWRVLPSRSGPVSEPSRELAPKPAAPVDVAHDSEARQLVAKARELFEALDSSRDDYKLAGELVEQAKAKDSADAEVWAAAAQLDERYAMRGWDFSDARREAARAATQRALRLDPQSFEARLAQAELLAYTGREGADKEKILRDLRRERPADHRVLRELGSTIERQERTDEGIAFMDEAAALPGGDPLALYNKSLGLWFAGRSPEAETVMRIVVAQRPFTGALLMNAWYAMVLHGDLAGAQATLDRIPVADMLEDRACFFAYYLHSLKREPDAALACLYAVPRDWLSDNWYTGPKDRLIGNALQLAGRSEAAVTEWRTALKLIDARLATGASNFSLVFNRTMLLARLGEREEAARQFAVLLQMNGVDFTRAGAVPPWAINICIALGRNEEAIRQIARNLKERRHAVAFTAAELKLDPTFDSLRNEPEFQKVITEAEVIEKRSGDGSQTTGDSGQNRTVGSNPEADPKSVAVLAFANLSDDKDNEYFSDGISEELLTVLQKIPGLHVAARTSAFSFKGKNATAQEIGATLHVATLVEGSVRKAGNSVRITARLSRAGDGEQLWSESYTRELKDVFAVQSEIAQTIVGQLRGQLGGASSDMAKAEIQAQVQAAEKGGTTNVEAHQLYLQGKYFLNQYSLDNMNRAIDLLQRAVDLDPKFALAWAELSQAGSLKGGYGMTKQEVDDGNAVARRAADRALALAPDLPATILALANARINDFDWKEAWATLRRAVALAPDDPEVVFNAAAEAYSAGEKTRAVELGRQAVALDPVNPKVRSGYAFALYALRRFDEAEAEFRRVIELNSTAAWGHGGVSLDYLSQGRFDEAVKEGEQESAGWARLFVLAMAKWGQGKKAESDATVAQLIKDYGEVAAYQVAEVYAFRRENDHAFEWLERALRQRDPGLAWSRPDLLLEGLHDDPRWPVFLHKLGLADDQLK